MADSPLGRALLLVGVLAVGLGAVATVAPGAVGPVGGDALPVGLLGLAALVLAFLTAGDYWNAPRGHAELPDAHRRDAAAVPGEAFDRALRLSARRGNVGRGSRRRVERYLRDAAVEALVDATGDPREAVEGRLDDGTWTDDPAAAALFAAGAEPTRCDRVRAALGRETTFQRRVRRAVLALERRTGGDAGA